MTVRSRHNPHPFCYSVKSELLEYDYNYDDSNKPPQDYPRIRDRGEYYVDSYNDQPWSFTFGTHETVRQALFTFFSATSHKWPIVDLTNIFKEWNMV